MLKQVEQDISEYGIIRQGDRITLGLSGGADSVCLLFLLLELKEKYGLTLKAVHVHHGLRGAEADGDEAFVRDLCERLQVPLSVRHADVRAFAKETGRSEEEAGRELRYRILREEAAGGKIATAHHSDDNCETILLNILRGTGLAGLSGIPQANGDIIRPLLHVSRAQIEEYLKKRGEPYRTDATNSSPEYTRNRIRLELLPWLEREINAGTREHLLNLARRAGEAEELVSALAEDFFKKAAGIGEGAVELPVQELETQPALVQKRALFMAVEAVCGKRKDITAKQLDALAALTKKQVGAAVSLPEGMTGIRTYRTLRIGFEPEPENMEFSCKMRFFVYANGAEPPRIPYTKWFDYDRIKDTLVWRNRQRGDTIALAGGRKSLQRYLIDEKIPAAQRDALPVLADGSNIVWIAGHRISERYKVTEKTVRIVEVTFRPKTKRTKKEQTDE